MSNFFLQFLFCFNVRQVFKHYFEELEEESLRDNFVVVVRGLSYRFLDGFLVLLFGWVKPDSIWPFTV